VRGELGWVYADPSEVRDDREVHQARASAGVRAGPIDLTGGLAYDLPARQWVSRVAGVRWTHPTGCMGIGATARFEVDRALPEVALRFDVAP
jgi:hypothetical protein